jgi:hypothetical protein
MKLKKKSQTKKLTTLKKIKKKEWVSNTTIVKWLFVFKNNRVILPCKKIIKRPKHLFTI